MFSEEKAPMSCTLNTFHVYKFYKIFKLQMEYLEVLK